MKLTRLRRPTLPMLAAVLDRYLREVSAHKKGEKAEQSIAGAWRRTRLAGRPVDRISNVDLIEIRDAWLTELAAATVVRRLAFLSHVYTVLRKDWGYATLANPVQLVSRPPVRDARDRRVLPIRLRGVDDCPRDELQWIIRETQSIELPVIATLAVETCMRRSELCAILREHVHLARGYIHLPDTKNGTARDVPLSPLARETLRRYLADKPSRGSIFSMRPDSVTRAFARARKRSREAYDALCRARTRRPDPDCFRDLRLHDMRHEGTSTLAPIFPLHELAKITGHHDTRMLLRYVHPDAAELARKIARSPRGKQQIRMLRTD